MGKLRYIWLFLLAALLAGGPVCSVALASGGGKAAAEGGEKADKKSDKNADGEDEVSGGKSVDDPVYVHIQPVNVPVMGNDGVEQLVTIRVSVQVKSRDVADQVRGKMPVLQDTIMSTLYGGLGNGSLRNGSVINIDKTKIKIARALNKRLASQPVEDVLIAALAQRRL